MAERHRNLVSVGRGQIAGWTVCACVLTTHWACSDSAASPIHVSLQSPCDHHTCLLPGLVFLLHSAKLHRVPLPTSLRGGYGCPPVPT